MRVNSFDKPLLCWLLLLLLNFSATAQRDPVKWGKVEEEELKMTTYEADTSAAALVLCNYGELRFNLGKGDIRYDFEQHKRIKILKRAGFDEGDVAIPFHKNEKIRSLQVQVFAPDGTKHPLKSSDFFEEKVSDNWSMMKFSAGNLTEGAVLEYRYTLESEYFSELREWHFQENIPTLWSEYRLDIPEWFDYVALTQGQAITTRESSTRDESILLGSSSSNIGSDKVPVKMKTLRYAMENVSALKREGFITTMEDYYSKVKFQLKGIQWPSQPYKPHMNSWQQLATELMEYEKLGEQITKDRNIKNLWDAISPMLAGTADNDEKIRIIYRYLADQIEWDGRYSLVASDKLDEVFARKSATSGELNLMFIGLVKKLGIEVHPLLVSTRSHGKMMELYPLLDQFNHLMAIVQYGGKMKVVDVGNQHRPIGLPRVNAFNNVGWVLNDAAPQWINLEVPDRESVTVLRGAISMDGLLEGDIQSRMKGFAAVDGREELSEKINTTIAAAAQAEDEGEQEKSGLRERYPDIEISNSEYTGLEDPEAPLNVKFHCRIPAAGVVNADYIYFSPVIMPAFEENPFKQENRTYPVDIPYTITERYVAALTLPEGYEVESVPEDIRIVLPENGGVFEITTKIVGNSLNQNWTLSLNQIHFNPDEYVGLKKFIDLVMEKQEEQVVLHKVN